MLFSTPATIASFSQIHERAGFFSVNDAPQHTHQRIHKDLPIVIFPDPDKVQDTDLTVRAHVVLVLQRKKETFLLEFQGDSVRMYGNHSERGNARKSYQEYGLFCLYSPKYFGFKHTLTLAHVLVDPTSNELHRLQLLQTFLRPSGPDPFCSQARQMKDSTSYHFPDYAGILST